MSTNLLPCFSLKLSVYGDVIYRIGNIVSNIIIILNGNRW